MHITHNETLESHKQRFWQNMSESPYNKYDSTTLWYNIIVWQYNTITLSLKYEDSVSDTLALSESSSQEGSEICFLSD